jgi:hypothetical protein
MRRQLALADRRAIGCARPSSDNEQGTLRAIVGVCNEASGALLRRGHGPTARSNEARLLLAYTYASLAADAGHVAAPGTT